MQLRAHAAGSKAERRLLERFLNSDELLQYRPYWSLADTGYAGTLTLVHTRLKPVRSAIQHRAANPPLSAADLAPIQHGRRRARAQPRPRRTRGGAALRLVHARAHVSERRAPSRSCLSDTVASYAPNNGHSDASRQRRIDWDERMTELAERLRRDNQCLIWAGGRRRPPAVSVAA